MCLWKEYSSQETPESKFANALDKMHSATQNMNHGCIDWTDFDIKYDDVVRVNRIIEKGSRSLWEDVKTRLDECKREGLIE
jgi:putative hydrolase of HD superfamily